MMRTTTLITIKKIIPPVLLLLTLVLGELYLFWHTPEVNEKAWFLYSDIKQDREWYIKDSAEAVTWLIFLGVWYIREKRNKFWRRLVGLFLIFRFVDLCAYWVNHRHAGMVYLFCYLSIIIYVGYTLYRNNYKYARNEK